MTILITGCAGFIGFHLANNFLKQGESVIGIDNLNTYYDPFLKENRLNILKKYPQFKFTPLDLSKSDFNTAFSDFHQQTPIKAIFHLAAQAGVRHSLKDPISYVHTNIIAHLNILENVKKINPNIPIFYASSSSVYGNNPHVPSSPQEKTDFPISPYGASKKSAELFSHAYSQLYDMTIIGFRFFTVYGPWGRPDMAAYIFTDSIYKQRPINIYNNGDMRRDFTYVDDIIHGIINCYNVSRETTSKKFHKIYNLGNNHPEKLEDFIYTLENYIGKKAIKKYYPMQLGDVKESFADISDSQKDFNFQPATSIKEGLKKFVCWYKQYHNM